MADVILATVDDDDKDILGGMQGERDIRGKGMGSDVNGEGLPRRPPFPTPEPSTRRYIPSTPSSTRVDNTRSVTDPSKKRTTTTSTNPTDSPLPLPLVPLVAPQIATLKATLKRRRSSSPPASIPTTKLQDSCWRIGGTPSGKAISSSSSTLKPDRNGPLPIPVPHLLAPETDSSSSPIPNFSSLLYFDPTPLHTPNNLLSSLLELSTAQSGESLDKLSALSAQLPLPQPEMDAGPSTYPFAGPSSAHPRAGHLGPDDAYRSPETIARFGSDLAWKTILGSVVDVEGVGEIDVIKVMLEVWRRGGGDVVTAQNLWLNIVIALQLPAHTPGARIPSPSLESADGLRKVYDLTLRPWEAAIFSGLLASYASNLSSSSTAPRPAAATPYYGALTPTKELDMSMWTNFSPGTGDLSALIPLVSGSTPKHPPAPSALGQFEYHAESDRRRRSMTVDSTSGLEALLAEMEEGHAANERAHNMLLQGTGETYDMKNLFKSSGEPSQLMRQSSTYQLPTPDTESTSPNGFGGRNVSSAPASCYLSPEGAASPYVTASTTASSVSRIIPSVDAPHVEFSTTRVAPPTSLHIPPSNFVPPPPMCMFFSPQYRDLERGKVGVWKGDLEIVGRGGGTFSILIVGEEGTGHFWQSHLWPSKIRYPAAGLNDAYDSASSCTSTMIPVAHLAREGFTPITMGMVLCNDANIEAYVSMVQGFHAEGVAFHLPNPARLPIVFLPAKFDSGDPLQRLGVAFMSKPGVTLPKPVGLGVKTQAQAQTQTQTQATAKMTAEQERKRKRSRRQSAPAKTNGLRRRRSSAAGSEKRTGAVKDGEAIQEEVIVEE